MTITGMKEFENITHNEAVKYFNANRVKQITEADVFTVWSCKTLQNYKALVSTNVAGDTTYFNSLTTAISSSCTWTLMSKKRTSALNERK